VLCAFISGDLTPSPMCRWQFARGRRPGIRAAERHFSCRIERHENSSLTFDIETLRPLETAGSELRERAPGLWSARPSNERLGCGQGCSHRLPVKATHCPSGDHAGA
jgi:hypothetical protein